MDREQLSEFSRQEYFILGIRECAERLSLTQFREETLIEAAELFAEFSGAKDAIIIDLSRECLDIYRKPQPENASEPAGATVILEESVAPLLDLLRDRYLYETGIRIFNQRIVNPPEGIAEDFISLSLDELGVDQGFIMPLTVVRNFGPENVQGILIINNVPSYRFADPTHLALLRMASDLLAVTSDNIDLGNALSRLRQTDHVTGLATRSRLQNLLNIEMERSQYFNRQFALISADIDNFKQINDKHGLYYGDMVIKSIAEDLRSLARPVDLICRWGGDEFMILVPEVASTAEARNFAQRCLDRIREHSVNPDDFHEEINVTVSFGVVIFPDHGSNQDTLLRHADLSVLHAKLNGRNKVVVWTDD